MSSADPLARPRVRGLAPSGVPEHPQTCALEHPRSGGRRRKWLIERSIAQHGDGDAEQAIADAAHRTRVVGVGGSQASVIRCEARVAARCVAGMVDRVTQAHAHGTTHDDHAIDVLVLGPLALLAALTRALSDRRDCAHGTELKLVASREHRAGLGEEHARRVHRETGCGHDDHSIV